MAADSDKRVTTARHLGGLFATTGLDLTLLQ